MRYKKYNHLLKNYQLSKFNIYSSNEFIDIKKIDIQSGHFKPSNLYVEHGLLLTNLTMTLPQVKLFKHGKREKNTALLSTTISSASKWAVIDNFIHIFIPNIPDLKIIKFKREKFESFYYSWRIRNFFEWEDYNILLSDRALKKNVFLPLYFNIALKNISNLKYNNQAEQFLRMLRLPISFYKKY